MSSDRPTTDSRGTKKSQVVSVRLDPKLKYLAELAARRQRRPLSSYIEWAIEESLSRVYPSYGQTSGYQPDAESFADVAATLWDVDEADRFANLAFRYPELLTHDEQLIWKLIRECGLLWRGSYGGQRAEWQWTIQSEDLMRERLREHWETFNKVARGALPSSSIPTWQKTRPPTSPKNASTDLDDEIPF